MVVVAGALLAGSVGGANASTLTYTYDVPSSAVPFTDNFTLPLFNTHDGTLTGVEVTLDGSVTGTISVVNFNEVYATFTNAFASCPSTLPDQVERRSVSRFRAMLRQAVPCLFSRAM